MQRTLVCKCSTMTPLPIGYIPKDGDVLMCGWCGTRYVVHLCNHDHGQSAHQSALKEELLEVLVNGITKACPPCGVWYRVGKFVERFDPQAGKAIQEVAIGAGFLLLFIKGLQYLDKRL